MKKRLLLFLVLGVVLLSACQVEEEYLSCPDNVTKVINLSNCPEEEPECPNCDDGYNCTLDLCNARTNYTCTHEEAMPCDGNGECETGEFPWSRDCPSSCDDYNECTVDSFNYVAGMCSYEDIKPCCGNEVCDLGETFVVCPLDCEQLLKIKIINYEKRQRISNAYNDLTGTDYTYLLVWFNIHNLLIDEREELYYKKLNGFYYDPFKMRLEGDDGKLYDIEYDSDLIEGYLDYAVIEKGHTVPASLLFVLPLYIEHTRLIVYDKFGSRLDIGDVY